MPDDNGFSFDGPIRWIGILALLAIVAGGAYLLLRPAASPGFVSLGSSENDSVGIANPLDLLTGGSKDNAPRISLSRQRVSAELAPALLEWDVSDSNMDTNGELEIVRPDQQTVRIGPGAARLQGFSGQIRHSPQGVFLTGALQRVEREGASIAFGENSDVSIMLKNGSLFIPQTVIPSLSTRATGSLSSDAFVFRIADERLSASNFSGRVELAADKVRLVGTFDSIDWSHQNALPAAIEDASAGNPPDVTESTDD